MEKQIVRTDRMNGNVQVLLSPVPNQSLDVRMEFTAFLTSSLARVKQSATMDRMKALPPALSLNLLVI